MSAAIGLLYCHTVPYLPSILGHTLAYCDLGLFKQRLWQHWVRVRWRGPVWWMASEAEGPGEGVLQGCLWGSLWPECTGISHCPIGWHLTLKDISISKVLFLSSLLSVSLFFLFFYYFFLFTSLLTSLFSLFFAPSPSPNCINGYEQHGPPARWSTCYNQ